MPLQCEIATYTYAESVLEAISLGLLKFINFIRVTTIRFLFVFSADNLVGEVQVELSQVSSQGLD